MKTIGKDLALEEIEQWQKDIWESLSDQEGYERKELLFTIPCNVLSCIELIPKAIRALTHEEQEELAKIRGITIKELKTYIEDG